MGDEAEPELSVEEFVEYCRTQARLLSGRIQTMGETADDLLDEIDEEMAEIRSRLDEQTEVVEGTETPASTGGPDSGGVDIAEIEDAESSVETKQARVEATRARMGAYQELATGYTDLAEELQREVEDGQEAMERVVDFEVEHDAPAYFEDRKTVYEAAAASSSESK